MSLPILSIDIRVLYKYRHYEAHRWFLLYELVYVDHPDLNSDKWITGHFEKGTGIGSFGNYDKLIKM